MNFFEHRQQAKPMEEAFPRRLLAQDPTAAATTVSMVALALAAASFTAATPPSRIATQMSCGIRGSRTSGCESTTGS